MITSASKYHPNYSSSSPPFLDAATVQTLTKKMDLILDHLDPVLLDGVYGSAFRLTETICAITNGTDPVGSQFPQPSSVIIGKSGQSFCSLAADPRLWQRHGLWRQGISIFFVTWLASSFFYLLFGTACYYRNFDQSLKKQPKFRPNQIRSEIIASLSALLVFNILTLSIFVAQVRGWAKIYAFGTGSTWYEVAQYPFFVLFSDTCMYWLHRAFHNPVLFRISHYKHHM
jgi:lathosterol oxidase